MEKKGFTLVELLIVITLIGLLFGIGVPGVMKISSKMKEKSYNSKVELIEQAGVLWGQDNSTLVYSTVDCDIEGVSYKCKKIKIKELIENDYLNSEANDKYFDPRDNSDIINNCVYIYKTSNRVYAYYNQNNTCT